MPMQTQEVEVQLYPVSTLALDGVGGQSNAPAAFTPRKETWYPFYRRLGGPQGHSGQVQAVSPPWGSNSGLSSPQLVAIPTTLSWPLKTTLIPINPSFPEGLTLSNCSDFEECNPISKGLLFLLGIFCMLAVYIYDFISSA